MIEENVEFLEEYKKLDNLVKGRLDTPEGITEYIRLMDSKNLSYKYSNFYKSLKQLRGIRNDLAHKPETMRLDMCDESDINEVIKLHKCFLEINDPISIEYRLNKKIKNPIVCDDFEDVSTTNNQKDINKTIILLIFVLLFLILVFICLLKKLFL